MGESVVNILNILWITVAQPSSGGGMRSIMQGIAGMHFSDSGGCRRVEKLDACDIVLAQHHLIQGIIEV